MGNDFFCEEPSHLLESAEVDDDDVLFDGQGLTSECAQSTQSGTRFVKSITGGANDALELRSMNANNNNTDPSDALIASFALFVR